MAIRTIPETVEQKRINNIENAVDIADNETRSNRRDRRSSSYFQKESTSKSTANIEGVDDLTEYRLSILNTITHVMLLAAISADAIGLSIYWHKSIVPNECMHLLGCESNILIYTSFQFAFAFLTLLWMITSTGCFCFSEDPTKEANSQLSLDAPPIRALTSAIFISCLIFALLGFGNEQIKSLYWDNMQNNNISKGNSQESFVTYELRPLIPAARQYVYSWDDSLDLYNISASITDRVFSLKETEEFLNKYNCDTQLPTFGGRFITILSLKSTFNSYTSSNMVCYPIHE